MSGGVVLASSRHVGEAQRFVAFLVSPAGQRLVSQGDDYEYPVRPGVAPNPELPPFASIPHANISVGALGDDLPGEGDDHPGWVLMSGHGTVAGVRHADGVGQPVAPGRACTGAAIDPAALKLLHDSVMKWATVIIRTYSIRSWVASIWRRSQTGPSPGSSATVAMSAIVVPPARCRSSRRGASA